MSNDSYGAFFYFLCIWSRLSHLHLAIYVRLKNKTPHFYHSHQYRRHYVNENVKFKWWNEWAEKSMILPLQFSIIIQEVESFYYFMKKKKKWWKFKQYKIRKQQNTFWQNTQIHLTCMLKADKHVLRLRDSWPPVFAHSSHLTADTSSVKSLLEN